MSLIKLLILFSLATTSAIQSFAADQETIGGIDYERIEGRWFVRDDVEELWQVAPGNIVIRFRVGASLAEIGVLLAQNGLSQPAGIPGNLYRYDRSRDPVEVLKSVLSSPLVRTSSLDTFLEFHEAPDDPYYLHQWHLRNAELERAWDITHGSANIKVAILDKGTQFDHEDLAETCWSNPGEIAGNGVDDDDNDFVDDVVGWDFVDPDNNPRPVGEFATAHGTACAGIAGAAFNNTTGVAGVAGGCRFVHMRANTTATAGAALRYCWMNGVDVVSMSFGASPTDSIFVDELDNAFAAGVVLVGSAGNTHGFPPDQYPAKHPNVIAVGAVDKGDTIAVYSSYGELMAPSRKHAVVTIDDDLWTTDNEGSFGGVPYPEYNPTVCSCPVGVPEYFQYFGGTSAACPVVAGIAALLLSHESNLTNIEVRERLRRGAVDIWEPGVDEVCGYGRVDAYRTLTQWGIIDENTTWSGTVYVSGDVEVAEGATLTIAAGTTVLIATDDNEHAGSDSSRIEFNIEGRLVAVGTLPSPIVFESWTPTSSDDWVGFYFDSESDGGKFTRCMIRDAEYAIESYADVEVRTTTIENCGSGIVSYDGTVFVKTSNIESDWWGVYASGGDVTVRDSAVSGASASCLQVQNGSSLVARGSEFTDGGNGLVTNTSAAVSVDSFCVFNSNDVGVAVFNAPSLAVVKRSTINSNTSYGIRCDSYSHALIESNTVRYNSVGIYCTNSSSPTIKGNTIKTNTFGVSAATDANPNIGICCSAGDNIIAYSSQKHVANWNDFEIKAQNNCWNVNTGSCYPPSSKIQGLVDVDLPQCCTTPSGSSAFIPEPKPEKAPAPTTELVSVVPNPFNPSSTIQYKLARRERVSIVVYDVAGRMVRDLLNRDEEPGSHTVWWDGTDAEGTAAASGVYFVKFSAGAVARTMKMILVK